MQSMVTRFGVFPSPADGAADVANTPTIDATRRTGTGPSAASASMPAVDPASTTNVDEARYQVKSVLGRGGMGEVRLCHDRRIGRDIAVKLVLSGGADAGVRARFLREARVQGQLEHPAIVPVHDLEVFPDGSAYFAMKRVRGRTLSDILHALRRGDEETAREFPQRKLLAAFNAVCLAVEFAHEKCVVHRDIKPGNIMLGNFGEVYLLDWGLAKLLAHDDDEPSAALAAPTPDTDATLAGSMLGTPGYMAPEQIDASLAPIGPATDVYALGAVLFEILSLQRYVQSKDALEATMLTLQGSEPRPSRRATPEVAASIAPALDELCARALAVAPAERVPSARAFHDAIDQHLAGAHDLERRRAQAKVHLEAALTHPDTEAGRSAALRELGSAVALDADNLDARRTLVRLLTTAPSTTPPAVRQRAEDDERARIRELAWMRAISLAPFAPLVPVALWLGVREPALFWACSFGLVVATPALNLVLARARQPHAWLEALAHLLFLASTAGFARMAGPLLVLPAAMVAYSVQLQLHPRPMHRAGVFVACCVTLLAAFGLEASDLIAPSYTVVEDGIMIHARMIALPSAALWFIALTALVTLVAPTVFANRARAALAVAEEKLHLQAWQLAQLVPADDGKR